jgi:hypothetical protein
MNESIFGKILLTTTYYLQGASIASKKFKNFSATSDSSPESSAILAHVIHVMGTINILSYKYNEF